MLGLPVAGSASSSDHLVGELQFLQPADLDPLPVSAGRSTRPLLATQETRQQGHQYGQQQQSSLSVDVEIPGGGGGCPLASRLCASLFRLRPLLVAPFPAGVGGLVPPDRRNSFVLRHPAGHDSKDPHLQDRYETCSKLALWTGGPSPVSLVSPPAFTYHQFNQFLKTVTFPCVWVGVLSLTWELITSMFRLDTCVCLCVCLLLLLLVVEELRLVLAFPQVRLRLRVPEEALRDRPVGGVCRRGSRHVHHQPGGFRR